MGYAYAMKRIKLLILCIIGISLMGCSDLSTSSNLENSVGGDNTENTLGDNGTGDNSGTGSNSGSGDSGSNSGSGDNSGSGSNTPLEEEISEELDVLVSGGIQNNILIVLNNSTATSGSAESIGAIPFANQRVGIVNSQDGSQPLKRYAPKFRHTTEDAQVSQRSTVLSETSLTHETTTHTFKALDRNLSESQTAQEIDATLRYGSSDSSCLIYVQNGQEGAYDWDEIGSQFDTKIKPEATARYGQATDIDSNGKVVILYYNFQNSVLGYFWNGNYFQTSQVANSNEMDIVYVNSVLQDDSLDLSIETVAHEYVHMIEFSERFVEPSLNGASTKPFLDTWVSEGAAELGADVLYKGPLANHFTLSRSLNSDIINGISLFDWKNDGTQYTLAYLFFKYLHIQASEQDQFTKDIINSTKGDHQNVEDSIKTHIPELSSFSEALNAATIAKYLVADNSVYGYRVDNDQFTAPLAQVPSDSNVTLGPGASVVYYPTDDELRNFTPSQQGSNIQYLLILPQND